MRDTEFRGKRKESNEWICGYLFVYESGECDIYRQDLQSEMNAYAVIPETIGQYTGLRDRKGAKIFEGDIVRDKFEIGQVYWHIEHASFYWGKGNTLVHNEELEVIGNIHDNPELLHTN